MNRRFDLLGVIADAMLVFSGTLACICAMPTAYGAVLQFGTLAAVCAFLALLASLTFHLVKGQAAAAAVYILGTAVFGFVKRRAVISGAKLLAYTIMKPLSLGISFIPVPADPPAVPDPAADITIFLIVVSAAVALLIALLLIKPGSPLPALLVPLPFLLLSLVYTDCSPALFTAMLLTVYIVGTLFGRALQRSGANRASLFRCGAVIVLFVFALLISAFSPADKYTPIPFAERQRMIGEGIGHAQDTVLSWFSRNPEKYDLTGEDSRYLSEAKAFSVKCSQPGVYLLRAHSYGLYGKNEWLPAEEYTGEWSSMLTLGSTQTGETAELYIRDSYTNERLVPYAFWPDDQVAVGESFIRANGKTAYAWRFVPLVRFSVKKTEDAEKDYYKFALKQYTLPEGRTKERLLKIMSEYGLLTYLRTYYKDDPYGTAMLIADYVREQGGYTLMPGELPLGADFVEHFMIESHAGFCVHFATATTALLQALKIPARCVIGYRANIPEADVWVDIPKKASHAWTEVYIKGVGWVPIESSNGFESDVGCAPLNPSGGNIPLPPHGPDATPIPLQPTPRPTANPRHTGEPLPTDEVIPTGVPRPAPAEEQSKKLWLLAIPGAILLYELIGLVIRKRRERIFSRSDPKTAVIAMLRYLDGLERHGAPSYPNSKEVAEEAAFSNHDMAETQRKLQRFTHKTQRELYRHKKLRRFVMRYVLFRI